MTLPSSGPISLSQVQTEWGGTNPISLSEYYGDGNAPASGAISIGDDFYGTTNVTINYLIIAGGGGGVVEHSAILVVVEEVLADILKPLTTGLKRARLTA